jgi:hypothetical protein
VFNVSSALMSAGLMQAAGQKKKDSSQISITQARHLYVYFAVKQ